MAATVEWVLCSVSDCSGKARTRGLCSRHYERFRSYGNATISPDEVRARRRRNLAVTPCVSCGGMKEEESVTSQRCSSCRETRKWLVAREGELRRRYGISFEQYEEMLRRQGGVCAICGGEPTKRYRAFDVDHDKITGRVRGLLCRRCNTGLGYVEAGFHVEALAYLGGGE